MNQSDLSCYYIDEPLSDEEFSDVSATLIGPDAYFKTDATTIVQRRVPAVLPAPEPDGKYAKSPIEHVELVRANLLRAGIASDRGKQVVWVVPRDMRWAATFQLSIEAETGFYPYAVQRWRREEEQIIRSPVRVMDVNGLMGG
jgi:hypothetical protein